MEIRFALPRFRSLFFAGLVLCIQMGIFLGGAFILFFLYNPPLNEAAGEFSSSLYPYALFEIGIFLLSSIIAFWISRWEIKTIVALFAAEIGVLLFVQLFSNLWGDTCTTLISLNHYPVLPKPSCGRSSLNPLSVWFGIFFVMTLLLWDFILYQRIKGKDTSTHHGGTLRINFEKSV